MIVFERIQEVSSYVNTQRAKQLTIGFVPTMGALHQGHISLVERSVRENDITIVSIFVNPIQFNNPEDLKKYPRNLQQDIEMLEKANVDVVFTPSEKEMYPEENHQLYDLGEFANVMEGAFRPGHFNGVAVVVHKLFDIVKPHKAYFGEKDYQQLQVIKKLVKDHNIPVEIVPCPISRDVDGLALSSRNARLSSKMRDAAPFIYAQLLKAREQAKQPDASAEKIVSFIYDSFAEHPLLKLEYFVVADGSKLQPVTNGLKEDTYGFIAVFAGDIRLIDNIRLF
ncbi:MAG TPA: pantoate--beta-alanine ligase [Lentimicrobium sp.]|nr:pantoate--beta-alanine ligase [Lentimicrobium sp.]